VHRVHVVVERRLGHRRAAGHVAGAGERRQHRLALRIAAAFQDRLDDQTRRQDVQRDREIAPRQLFAEQRAGHRRVVGAVAAVALGDGVLHQPELPGLLSQCLGHLSALVGVARRRPDLLGREGAHGLADELLIFGWLEIDHHVLLLRAGAFAGLASHVRYESRNVCRCSVRSTAADPDSTRSRSHNRAGVDAGGGGGIDVGAEHALLLADFDDAAQERAEAAHHVAELRREPGIGPERLDHQRDDHAASVIALGGVLQAHVGDVAERRHRVLHGRRCR
jgi:hypothetical protein